MFGVEGMNINFEATAAELQAAYGDNCDFSKPIEITLGKEVFTCWVTSYDLRKENWRNETLIQVHSEGRSKRLQDIEDAKALVNKTKEAHKEAQRKLAALTENK